MSPFLKPITLALICFLSACGNMAVLEPDSDGPTADESVIVLGVRPASYEVLFFPVELADGGFRVSAFSNAVISGFPRDGYIVAKVSGRQAIGILKILAKENAAQSFGSPTFTACGGAQTLVVEVPKGEAIYLGDVTYTRDGKGLRARYADSFEEAQAHLRNQYPRVTQALKRYEVRHLLAKDGCGGAVTIPIYLGR